MAITGDGEMMMGLDSLAVVGDQAPRQIEEERVNRRAQRYLRDLRRDAVIDYR